MVNFKKFALHYLNDWCTDDCRFFQRLCTSNSGNDQLDCLWEAAKYYSVIRTLKNRSEEVRLAAAMDALNSTAENITEDNVVEEVCGLASALQQAYGAYAISAASKFLWLRHRSPVTIYDSRAIACLNQTATPKLAESYYAPYRTVWLEQFQLARNIIAEACSALSSVKPFSYADTMSAEDFAALTASDWFYQRVFDKYLWRTGGD